jgi:hypothetical protein
MRVLGPKAGLITWDGAPYLWEKNENADAP